MTKLEHDIQQEIQKSTPNFNNMSHKPLKDSIESLCDDRASLS